MSLNIRTEKVVLWGTKDEKHGVTRGENKFTTSQTLRNSNKMKERSGNLVIKVSAPLALCGLACGIATRRHSPSEIECHVKLATGP